MSYDSPRMVLPAILDLTFLSKTGLSFRKSLAASEWRLHSRLCFWQSYKASESVDFFFLESERRGKR